MKKTFHLTIFTICLLLLTACVSVTTAPSTTTEAASAPEEITTETATTGEGSEFTAIDATGETISLDTPATKIACVVSNCIDIVYSLGLEPIAVTSFSAAAAEFYGERAESFAQIGGGFSEPNLEDIVAAEPDLVIAYAGDQPGLRPGLPNIPVFFIATLTMDDAIEELRSIAKLTGKSEVAESVIAEFEGRLEQYKAQITEKVTAGAISGSGVNFELLTDQSPAGSVLAQIAEYPFPLPAGAQHYGGFVAYSMEELLAQDPAVLLTLTPTWSDSDTPLSETLAETPLWQELTAVKEGNVYDVPSEWVEVGGLAGMTKVLDQAAVLIYPDIFPTPLP